MINRRVTTRRANARANSAKPPTMLPTMEPISAEDKPAEVVELSPLGAVRTEMVGEIQKKVVEAWWWLMAAHLVGCHSLASE